MSVCTINKSKIFQKAARAIDIKSGNVMAVTKPAVTQQIKQIFAGWVEEIFGIVFVRI